MHMQGEDVKTMIKAMSEEDLVENVQLIRTRPLDGFESRL
jgi:hypothetical protein